MISKPRPSPGAPGADKSAKGIAEQLELLERQRKEALGIPRSGIKDVLGQIANQRMLRFETDMLYDRAVELARDESTKENKMLSKSIKNFRGDIDASISDLEDENSRLERFLRGETSSNGPLALAKGLWESFSDATRPNRWQAINAVGFMIGSASGILQVMLSHDFTLVPSALGRFKEDLPYFTYAGFGTNIVSGGLTAARYVAQSLRRRRLDRPTKAK